MIRRAISIFGATLATLMCAGSLQAAVISQTFYMNQSNSLTDGVNYGVVKITADKPDDPLVTGGTVKFEVTAPYVSAYNGSQPASNYGLATFFLNTNSLFLPTAFSVQTTSNWEFGYGQFQASDFGWYDMKFDLVPGAQAVPSLTFTLNLVDKTKATIENFANLHGPAGKDPSDYFFSAHIRGFESTNGYTSHQVAGSVPEPSTIVLWSLVGVGGLAFARRFRKK